MYRAASTHAQVLTTCGICKARADSASFRQFIHLRPLWVSSKYSWDGQAQPRFMLLVACVFITCCQRSRIHPPEPLLLNSRVPKSVALGDCENWFLDPPQSFWFLRAKVGLEDKHFYCKFPDATTNYWWWWETIWENSLGSAFSGRESSSLPTFKGCLGHWRKSGLYPSLPVLPHTRAQDNW